MRKTMDQNYNQNYTHFNILSPRLTPTCITEQVKVCLSTFPLNQTQVALRAKNQATERNVCPLTSGRWGAIPP